MRHLKIILLNTKRNFYNYIKCHLLFKFLIFNLLTNTISLNLLKLQLVITFIVFHYLLLNYSITVDLCV